MLFLNQKKLHKFKRNPKAFFMDALVKKISLIHSLLKRLKPKKYKAYQKYVIVSAVYNVEKYLDDYFRSIIKQRLDFKNNIILILIDDGSTDNSANIIKRYQKKFPKNIIYLYKENGGQASARNLGLDFLQVMAKNFIGVINYNNTKQNNIPNIVSLNTNAQSLRTSFIYNIDLNIYSLPFLPTWVTFTDTDDFLDRDYFYEADRLLEKHSNEDIKLIHAHILSYQEQYKITKQMFLEKSFIKNRIILQEDLQDNDILFYAPVALYQLEIITSNMLSFDEKCKPHYEDGKFLAFFIFHLSKDAKICFLKSALYYYRQREDLSSTINKRQLEKSYYLNVPKYGYLNVLEAAQKHYGFIPNFIQNTILYDLMVRVEELFYNPDLIRFLPNRDEQQRYFYFLKECFAYIDITTIMNFSFKGWFHVKFGIIHLLKQEKLPYYCLFFECIDDIAHDIALSFYTNNLSDKLNFYIDKKEVFPYYEKRNTYNLLNKIFINKKTVYIKIAEDDKVIEAFFNKQRVAIFFCDKVYRKIRFETLRLGDANAR